MKRTLSLLLACTASAMAFAGCGSQPTPASSSSPTVAPSSSQEAAPAEQKASLRYAIWNADQAPALQQVIDDFKAENAGIDIALEVVAWDQYWLKLEAAVTTKDLPDVFWMNAPNFQKYASNGILADLAPLTSSGAVDMKNYAQSLVDIYTYEGKNYGIPKDYDTIGLWYNKELFDNAGVAYPDATWTWDTVIEAAQKLNDPTAGIYGFGAPLKDQEGYYNVIPEAGGYVISPDGKSSGFSKPETVAGIRFLSDMVNKYQVSPTLAQYNENPNMTLFENGKVAMQFGGSWRAVSINKNELIRGKADVAPMPKGPASNTCVVHGLAHSLSAFTKNQDAAGKFLAYLGGQHAAEVQAKTGTVLPAYNGAAQQWIDSSPEMNLQVFVDAVETSTPFPASKDTSKWANVITEKLTEVWTGVLTPEEAAAQIDSQMNEFLAAEQ